MGQAQAAYLRKERFERPIKESLADLRWMGVRGLVAQAIYLRRFKIHSVPGPLNWFT